MRLRTTLVDEFEEVVVWEHSLALSKVCSEPVEFSLRVSDTDIVYIHQNFVDDPQKMFSCFFSK